VVRLDQNFLADTNLLEAIVRDADLDAGDVVLEVGAGEGALSDRVAPRVAHLHAIELDRRLADELEAVSARHPNLSLVWGDAMRADLRTLEPSPTAVVSNLPYSIATPVLLRTVAELPEVAAWTVMVQREIADRLRASPGSRTYGAPSVLIQLACEVELLRTVDRAVFRPRPRVDSALLRLTRKAAAPPPALARLVRDAFAHRRKPLAGSLELAGGPSREAAREALGALGLDSQARAEALAPADFVQLAERLEVR
jgi:16S rRNA (adenine1518-N6/adenine1519-N6)-dimethyltransferase